MPMMLSLSHSPWPFDTLTATHAIMPWITSRTHSHLCVFGQGGLSHARTRQLRFRENNVRVCPCWH